jgi:hypothetical protein
MLVGELLFGFFVVVAGLSFLAAIFLFSLYKDVTSEVELLRREVSSKTSDTMYEFERKHRRDIQDELEALKEYLCVTAVKVDPKMQMVEKYKVAK